MDIDYYALPAEDIDFPEQSFDVITACQCFWYFDYERVSRQFFRMLKPGGRILALYMAWLPFEDKIAGASEKLVYHEEYPLNAHFTRESWNGRMKACRGVGASLSEEEINLWEREHVKLLAEIAPDEFDVLHYGAIAELKAIK